jgi:hypothetical protein
VSDVELPLAGEENIAWFIAAAMHTGSTSLGSTAPRIDHGLLGERAGAAVVRAVRLSLTGWCKPAARTSTNGW